jgi:hypothetical protein
MRSGLPVLAIFVFLTVVFNSCKKGEQFPVEPAIQFKSLEKFSDANGVDTALVLSITFTDGDGDIGLKPEDVNPPFNPGSEYYYNLYATYFIEQGGVFVPLPVSAVNGYRIPYIENKSSNKAISGELKIDMEILGLNLIAPEGNFRFEVYIYDRALHKSNVITTDPIYLKNQ